MANESNMGLTISKARKLIGCAVTYRGMEWTIANAEILGPGKQIMFKLVNQIGQTAILKPSEIK